MSTSFDESRQCLRHLLIAITLACVTAAISAVIWRTPRFIIQIQERQFEVRSVLSDSDCDLSEPGMDQACFVGMTWVG